MVDSEQLHLWNYILIQYFNEHGYSNLNLVGKKNVGKEKEVWMIALENKDYNIIHISNCLQQADSEYLNEMCNMLEEAINEPVKMLNINLFETTETILYHQAIDSICLLPNKTIEEKILKQFPNLDKVLYISQDVKKDTEAIISKTRFSFKKLLKEQRKKTRVPAGLMFKVVSVICIVIFLAITLIEASSDSINTTSASIALGGYYKAFVTVLGQYWRLLTSGFVHSGLIHLLCNLYALYYIGRVVEAEFGTLKAFIILIAGIIFGNALVFILKDNIVAYGLSGGINGLYGALVARCVIKGYIKDKKVKSNLLSNLTINLAISFLPNISLLAHLGGFVIGCFLGTIFCTETEKTLRNNFIISLVLIVIATGYLEYRNKDFSNYYLGTDKQVIELYQKVHLSNGKELSKLISYYELGE